MGYKTPSGDIDPQDISGLIRDMIQELELKRGAVTAKSADGVVTYTAAEMIGGVIQRSGSGAVTDVTATAAAIVAAIPNCEVGDNFDFTVVNTRNNTITMDDGVGVTLAGTTTIATNKTRQFRGTVTNVGTPAVTLLGVSLGDV
jgi:hypothetical protein